MCLSLYGGCLVGSVGCLKWRSLGKRYVFGSLIGLPDKLMGSSGEGITMRGNL